MKTSAKETENKFVSMMAVKSFGKGYVSLEQFTSSYCLAISSGEDTVIMRFENGTDALDAYIKIIEAKSIL